MKKTNLLDSVREVIGFAQAEFAALLGRFCANAMTRRQYQRYLSMQYHLTRSVQQYFLRAAAHSNFANLPRLRRFLIDFACEEEKRCLIAANDLAGMGAKILSEPFDVTLWHEHFLSVVDEGPFIRLGAACVLENMSGGAARSIIKHALGAEFLTRDNSKFVVLHQYETAALGEQILAELDRSNLMFEQLVDLALGAKQGAIFYLRMAQWAVDAACWSAVLDENFRFAPLPDELLENDCAPLHPGR